MFFIILFLYQYLGEIICFLIELKFKYADHQLKLLLDKMPYLQRDIKYISAISEEPRSGDIKKIFLILLNNFLAIFILSEKTKK